MMYREKLAVDGVFDLIAFETGVKAVFVDDEYLYFYKFMVFVGYAVVDAFSARTMQAHKAYALYRNWDV